MEEATISGSGVQAVGVQEREMFHLRDLVRHPKNPRQVYKEAEILSLAQSIAANGLGEDLKGERITVIEVIDGVETPVEKIGVIDGGRRTFAMKMIEERSPGWADMNPIPVKILSGVTEVDALVLNVQRASLNVYEEIIGYRALLEKGLDPEEIGRRMGVSVRKVRQRLRLAWLPDEIIEDLNGGRMTIEALSVYATAATGDQALAVFRALGEGARGHEYSVRNALSETRIDSSHPLAQFIDRDEYKRRGGRIDENLFGEGGFFQDLEIAQQLVAERLAVEAKTVQAEGWSWVEALTSVGLRNEAMADLVRVKGSPRGLTADEQKEFDAFGGRDWWQLEGADRDRWNVLKKLERQTVFSDAERRVSGVLLYIGHDGALRREEGLIRPEDKAEALESGVVLATRLPGGSGPVGLSGGSRPEKDPTELSKKLKITMRSIRVAAVQNVLANDPDLAFDALVFALAGDRDMRTISGIRQQEESIWTGDIIDGLDGVVENEKVLNRPRPETSFAMFRARSLEDKLAMMAAAVARSFRDPSFDDARSGAFDAFGLAIGADVRSVWTPTVENFLGSASKARLFQIAEEIGLDLKPLKAMKKGEIAQTLHDIFNDDDVRRAHAPEIIEAADRWRPKDGDFVLKEMAAPMDQVDDDDFVDETGVAGGDETIAAE